MTITHEAVAHVATLARLDISAEDAARYAEELSKILTLVEQLNTLPLDDPALDAFMDETMATDIPQQAVLTRPDLAFKHYTREALLKNAPEEEEGFFRVPKILEENSN
ncbi:MAG: Asp-tRNA(Asn)/Glu-tRNA(Gln) amidotransferase subunit GatC [Cyanobacteria bacterium]|nr:Asp-tRNA(Asn)/Glu-tRNA(Gln) amidotransferase subunit GatC [Cyanobacteriota bacterium]